MRRTMPRKRAQVAAGNEAADELINRVGKCEFCRNAYFGITQHEISRGSQRLTARLEPAASIVVCPDCHMTLHELPKHLQVLIGLAILRRSRPEDYSLKRFIEIECPHAPQRYQQRDIDLWSERLSP
jgi:hypothetical protein